MEFDVITLNDVGAISVHDVDSLYFYVQKGPIFLSLLKWLNQSI